MINTIFLNVYMWIMYKICKYIITYYKVIIIFLNSLGFSIIIKDMAGKLNLKYYDITMIYPEKNRAIRGIFRQGHPIREERNRCPTSKLAKGGIMAN